MTQTTHPLRLAGSAVAAALAIHAIPAIGQALPGASPVPADPVIVVPDLAPVAAPPAPAEPVVAEPVAPPPAVVAAPAPQPTRTAVRAAEASRPASLPPARTSPTEEQTAPEATIVQDVVPLPPVTSVAPVSADPVVQAPAERNVSQAWIAALAALGAAVLLLLGWFGLRRSPSSRAPRRYRSQVVPPVAAPRTDDVRTEVEVHQTLPFARPPGPVHANLAPDGAAVALPRAMPETYAERDALLRRMIAARPDRANPFHAPRARARRARLIMQSLGHRFDRPTWIDLSQYPRNWPELAGERASAA